MSSAPHTEEDLQITVKRDPGGLVSNWLNDNVSPEGIEIHAAPPAGTVLSLRDSDRRDRGVRGWQR